MGPYCKFCDHRCFVPDPKRSGYLLATCSKGMKHDRTALGYDHHTARAVGLNATALETLHAAGVSVAQWCNFNHMDDTWWQGDSCGCPDDRCIGFHHHEPDDCGCLPALLADYHTGGAL